MMENLPQLNSDSNIVIVGGGWFGCHTLRLLTEAGFNCLLLESNNEIFMGSSGHNQNRLHLGYHYPRSYSTRIQSRNGYSKFVDKYGMCLADVPNNIYSIHKDSILDAQTYLSIFRNEGYVYREAPLISAKHTASIFVNEKYINATIAKKYFSDFFEKKILYNQACRWEDGELLANGDRISYDLLIDCTYGGMIPNLNYFKRGFISFIVKKIGDINFGALTVMDGPFYSIYPYSGDFFTVTGVVEGVVDGWVDSAVAYSIYLKLSKKIQLDFPAYDIVFEYFDYFFSWKNLPISHDDRRDTVIRMLKKNVISVSGGKIDTIFQVDEFFRPLL